MSDKQDLSLATRTTYAREVFGVKNYLCPQNIYSLRSFKGAFPCQILVVVFQSPSFDQKQLLEKIMASIQVFEYSLLEVKDEKVLDLLLSSPEKVANFICFFGGQGLVKQDFLNERILQVCSLKQIEGSGLEVQKRKKQVWEQLKKWRKV